uniref:Uncharacterized protein n=1 Tax=Meloidogyne enterolobii TaxID=390850 RepID=A0A6V7UDP9_MELEN|nr:unnamed protein product [Meloidogyne enterolobii]
MKEQREKRMAENEERKRKNRETYGNDSDSDRDEREKKRRKKEKHHSSSSDHKRKRSPSNNYSGSVRDEAKTPQKRNFAPVVQCCVCELIVSKERFGGRDTLFCSQECISKKAEDARKCVKEGERILVIDHKGAMMNHSNLNPTIENLEEFLLANPSYQPVLASEQIEEANQRLHDPVYQKKVESMRVDVRKAIETALQKRSKSANMNFSLKRYKDLGMEIERSLFSIHQDVNLRYRKWFKSFITVINDEMNGFFRDVLRDKVSVKKLVTLSNDQMNVPLPQKDQTNNSFSISSTVIAAPSTSNSSFNVAAAELTSISEMPEENAINESFTSADSISTIRKKIGPTTSRHSMVKKTPLICDRRHLGDMNKDTTHLHQSHLYDANCGVCKQMNLRKFAEKERKERLEAKLEQKKSRRSKKWITIKFPNLDPSIQAAMLEASAAETASNELDFLKQKKNRQQRETFDTSPSISNSNNMLLGGDVILGRCDDPLDQERRLRDPLGLESVDALPPEEENVHEEDDNMSTFGQANDDDFDDGGGDFNNNIGDDGCYESEMPLQQLASERHNDTATTTASGDFRSTQNDHHSHQKEKHKENDQIVVPRVIPPFEQIKSNNNREIDNNGNWNMRRKSFNNGNNGGPSPTVNNVPMRNDEQQEFIRGGQKFTNKHQVWRGKFIWNSFISFDCKLTAISNRGAFKAGRELPQSLQVMGRSEANGVWHYIGRLTDSWDKQVILLLVEHPQDTYQYELYMRCFEKVSSCDNQQIIVLDLAGHEHIKDGYVFTLGPGMSLPSVLLPLDGPGLPDWCMHRAFMIIMLVRRMDREDKLWRKQQDESWRQQRTLQPLPSERFDSSTPQHQQKNLSSPFDSQMDWSSSQQQIPNNNSNLRTPNISDMPNWRKPRVAEDSLITTVSCAQPPVWPPPEDSCIASTSQNLETTRHHQTTNSPHLNNNRHNSELSNNNNILLENGEEIQLPIIETVDELLREIRDQANPEHIILLVGNFLQAHSDLTTEERLDISLAVRQRTILEQNKGSNNNIDNVVDDSTRTARTPTTALLEYNNEKTSEKNKTTSEVTNVVVEQEEGVRSNNNRDPLEEENETEKEVEQQQEGVEETNEATATNTVVVEGEQQPTNESLRPYSPSDFIIDTQIRSIINCEDLNVSKKKAIEPRRNTAPSQPSPLSKLPSNRVSSSPRPVPPSSSPVPPSQQQQHPPPPPPPPPSSPPPPPPALSEALSSSPQPPPPPPTTTTIASANVPNASTFIPMAVLFQQPPPPSPFLPCQLLQTIPNIAESTTTNISPSKCLLPPPPPPPLSTTLFHLPPPQIPPNIAAETTPISNKCLLPPPPPPPSLQHQHQQHPTSSNILGGDYGGSSSNVNDDSMFCEDIELDNFDSITALHSQKRQQQQQKRMFVPPSPTTTPNMLRGPQQQHQQTPSIPPLRQQQQQPPTTPLTPLNRQQQQHIPSLIRQQQASSLSSTSIPPPLRQQQTPIIPPLRQQQFTPIFGRQQQPIPSLRHQLQQQQSPIPPLITNSRGRNEFRNPQNLLQINPREDNIPPPRPTQKQQLPPLKQTPPPTPSIPTSSQKSVQQQ